MAVTIEHRGLAKTYRGQTVVDAVLQHGGTSALFGCLMAATLLAGHAATLVTEASLVTALRDVA